MLDYIDLAGNVGETIDETSDDSEVTLDMSPPADFTIGLVGSLQGELVEEESKEPGESGKKTKKKKNELGLIPLILFAYFGLSFLTIGISYIKIFSKGRAVLVEGFHTIFQPLYFYKNCRKTSMVYCIISYSTNWIFVIGFSDCKILWEKYYFFNWFNLFTNSFFPFISLWKI